MLKIAFSELNKNHQLKQLKSYRMSSVLTDSPFQPAVDFEKLPVLLCHPDTCSHGNKIHISVTPLFNVLKSIILI